MKTDKKEKSNIFLDWILPAVLAVIIGLMLNKFVLMRIIVPSGSMESTIMTGDVMYVTKVYHPEKLERGDIVAFYANDIYDTQGNKERFIKRLIGLPGDKVSVKNGIVSVNGKVLDEPYVQNNEKSYSNEFEVPEGKYLFFGDNRSFSNDARKWKNPYIDKSQIIAKAGLRVRPLNRFGFIK